MSFKSFFQYVEWILHYALLRPAQRRLLVRRFQARKPAPSRGRRSAGQPSARGTDREDPGKPARIMAHWVGDAGPRGRYKPDAAAIPDLAPGLMLVIIGCVIFVTACSLWFVSQGWVEALYIIPIFVISVFAGLLCRGLKPKHSASRRY